MNSFDFANSSSVSPVTTKPPAETTRSERERPDFARPSSIAGSSTSSWYLRVQKPCGFTPSATSAAARAMLAPTAAMVTLGSAAVVVGGTKYGVISVC